MAILSQYYETMAHTIIKGLEKRNMEGFYFSTSKEAVDKIMELIPQGASVSWGGSVSMKESGLADALAAADITGIDRSAASSPEEKRVLELQSFGADYYVMSTNAITQDGELVNIDGNGNRAAALIYGPKHVIILAGMNKVAADAAAAIERVHTHAAPPNAMRLGLQTPCALTGVCKDCLCKDCICAHTVVTRYSRHPGRIKVFLVGEALGF